MKKIDIKGLNETILYNECKNGLKIFMWPNKKSNTFYATLSINYGSIYQDFKINNKIYHHMPGVAHYLEHLKFNEKKGVTAHDFFNKLGSDTNAFTTFNYTNYQVYSSDNDVANISHLVSFVNNDYFTNDLVKKEKGIIIEEAKMGEDTPYTVILFKHLNNLFHNYSHKNYITGSPDEIKDISLKEVKEAYDNFYKPSNMFLCVTGNFNEQDILNKIKDISNNKKDKNIPKRIVNNEKDEVVKEYEELTLNITNKRLRYGIKINKNNFKSFDDLHIRLYTDIILNSLFDNTSDIKDELLRKKLITNLNTTYEIFDNYLTVIISSDTEYPEEIINRIDELFKNISISETIFNRKKKALIASLILDYEDIEIVNSIIQQEVLYYGKIINNIKDVYEKLNYKDLLKFIKYFSNQHKSILVLKPQKKEE